MCGLRAENKSRTCRGMHLNWIVCSFDRTMERLVRKILELVEEFGDLTPEGTGIAHYIISRVSLRKLFYDLRAHVHPDSEAPQ